MEALPPPIPLPSTTLLFQGTAMDTDMHRFAVRRIVITGGLQPLTDQSHTRPFPRRAQKQVAEITRVDAGPGWSLHAETGLPIGREPGVGWWMGWG
jgi:hypothetical protein